MITNHYLILMKKTQAALSDVAKIKWLRPNKSDKGPIILRINGNFDLSLWSKRGLDEWMDVLTETCQISKIKRPGQPGTSAIIDHDKLDSNQLSSVDLYQNTQTVANTQKTGGDTWIGLKEMSNNIHQQPFEINAVENRDNNRSVELG